MDSNLNEVQWASSYHAYERLAGGPGELELLLRPAREAYARTGRVPSWCGVDLLRGWAFHLHRLESFAGAEWDAVLGAIRHHPAATADDLPEATIGEPSGTGSAVLGVDACPAGWVGVLIRHGRATVLVEHRIDVLVAAAEQHGPLAAIGIDIPIGLPDAGRRRADILARQRVGRRKSSVFTTPVRPALEAPSYADAIAINRARTGIGLSKQAHGLRAKVLQVDDWVHTAEQRVIEVHPEVSFAEMNRAGLAHPKTTVEGARERLDLLRIEGITLSEPLKRPHVGVDDVIDAAAAAWTARRHAAGDAVALPDPPERFSDGWPAAIWV